ncbi:hypothetical protein [Virgibacillus byunsanensis]|uniref:hypothetical protein n=1 Tax=Virgibacillus byunsanensis TaxID=570945 RepID=UPI0036F19795
MKKEISSVEEVQADEVAFRRTQKSSYSAGVKEVVPDWFIEQKRKDSPSTTGKSTLCLSGGSDPFSKLNCEMAHFSLAKYIHITNSKKHIL